MVDEGKRRMHFVSNNFSSSGILHKSLLFLFSYDLSILRRGHIGCRAEGSDERRKRGKTDGVADVDDRHTLGDECAAFRYAELVDIVEDRGIVILLEKP